MPSIPSVRVTDRCDCSTSRMISVRPLCRHADAPDDEAANLRRGGRLRRRGDRDGVTSGTHPASGSWPPGPAAGQIPAGESFLIDRKQLAGMGRFGVTSGDRDDLRGRAGLSLIASFAVSLICFSILLFLKATNPIDPDLDRLILATDDAMRLTQVRDFLEGQGWYDLRQHRLGAEDAPPMHWSRVIDLPIAGLILGFELLVERERAMLAAMVVWPLIGAYFHFLISLAIGARLAGLRGLICTALVVLPYVIFDVNFQPGRVDYHGQQAVLMLTMALLLISGAGRPWRPAIAGGVACLSLSIGVAYVPFILVAGLVLAGRWVLDARANRAEAAGFFLSLALGAPIAMVLTVSPDQWGVGWCDALSVVFATGFFLGAGIAGLAVLALPTESPRGLRLAGLGIAALAAVGAVYALSPACFAGPYAHLDSETADWLRGRGEALDALWAFAEKSGKYAHRITLWPLVGLAGLALGTITAPAGRRDMWVLLLALALTGWLISLYQLRGGRMALPFTILGAGYLLARIVSLQAFSARVLKPIFVLALLWSQTPFARVLFDKSTASAENEGGRNLAPLLRQCSSPEAMAPLAALPEGRVAASIDLGSFLLLRTPHWALASPHHRNYAGNRAAIRLARADRETTYRILEEWRIDYVVTCEGWPTNVGADWLSQKDTPPWLRPLSTSEPLNIYRFVRK